MKFAVSLPAADMERAKAWYASALDLVPDEVTDFGDAWHVIDGTRVQLYASQFAGTNKATAATIEVDDVQATVDLFKARGVVFEDYDYGEDFRTVDGVLTAPDGHKLAWFKDSEGNILAIAPA
jgi:catechol 2,3-dioxygenase-like lactoylglutathione lyase family enzyme